MDGHYKRSRIAMKALKLHHEMLSDRPRTLAYLNAIQTHKGCFKDKVVLDVGCGTGVLSMFAAKFGQAKKIFAVEASDIAIHAEELIKTNGLDDIVHVINTPIEDAEIDEKVDLIISEWMGTFLLFEFMIEAVLTARNLYLKEEGTMWPGTAVLHLAPVCASEVYGKKVAFWKEQYGLDFKPLLPLCHEEVTSRPIIDHVIKPEDCLADDHEILHVDMRKDEISDLEQFSSPFCFKICKSETCHGFVSWFLVEFGSSCCGHEKVQLSTSPFEETTHWKQALFLMDDPFSVVAGDEVKGTVEVCRNSTWRRHLSIQVEFEHISKTESREAVQPMKKRKTFFLWR